MKFYFLPESGETSVMPKISSLILNLQKKEFWFTIVLTESLFVYVSMLAPKLIWAAARGRCNDDTIRLWVRNKVFPVPKCGVFYLPQHRTQSDRVQGTLWLYVTRELTGLLKFCWWRSFGNFGFPFLGSNLGPLVQRANDLTAWPPGCLIWQYMCDIA